MDLPSDSGGRPVHVVLKLLVTHVTQGDTGTPLPWQPQLHRAVRFGGTSTSAAGACDLVQEMWGRSGENHHFAIFMSGND